MKVEQIKNLVNDISKEVLGTTELTVADDLSNIVDFGKEVINTKNLDNYVKSLIDHIGKVTFVDRPYRGSAPSVLMDSWEYGSVLEKISLDALPEATENDSWNLQDGKSYDENIFTAPKVSAKFFQSQVTYEIPMSFAEKQVKSAFDNATQLNSFFSMIQNGIHTAMTVKNDGLIMSTINSMTAATIADGNDNRCVNLLTIYNAKFSKTLSAEAAITDPEFIRWAGFYISLVQDRLSKLSTLFNIGGKERFTSADRTHLVMLDIFAKAADVFMQSDVYHNELTKLPNAEYVPYWQGSGSEYTFDSISSINVKIQGKADAVKQNGILAVMFDRDAVGVSNLDQRVTSKYNARGEFYNNWYKFDAGYFNDQNENFIVFYVA